MLQALPDQSVITPAGPAVLPPLTAATAEQRRRADDTRAWFARNEVYFGVSVAGEVVQRPIPFDPLPRIVDSVGWAWLERALAQRGRGLGHFLRDAHGDRRR